MASYDYSSSRNYSSQRGVAMMLALATAIVLSPLYVNHHCSNGQGLYYLNETKWSSGLVVPMVLAGLIVAIKTTTASSSSPSSSSMLGMQQQQQMSSDSSSWVLRMGSSSWGLAGVLVMLIFLLSCQHSVQNFLWR